jgi:thiamine biosynthesis lipoprotein
MASPLRLAVSRLGTATATRAAADAAWAGVCAEFEAAEQAMSRFRDTSDLTRLNRVAGTGVAVDVPRRLERAVAAADRAHRLTDGRFDPRVLGDLERLGYQGAAVDAGRVGPGDASGRWGPGPVVARVGPGRLRVEVPIDLGGIGKGLALRWAAAVVERHGIDGYLLEAGGDLVARGASPDGEPWLVGIEDPAGGDAPLAAIVADDLAVATSSVRRRAWVQDGRAVHHLLDPQSGEPAEGGLSAVTVAGPDPAWAEIWSKTLFIGGQGGVAREARQRGLAAWWVTDEGTLAMTPAARERTAWVTGED